MILNNSTFIICILSLLCIILLFLLKKVITEGKKKQLERCFSIIFILIIYWLVCLIVQVICINKFDVNPVYFEYFAYITGCFIPVVFLFIALIFARTNINFSKKYLLLFVIPVISLIILWTNDLHHLFYVEYSLQSSNSVFGNYFYVHFIYTYSLFASSLYILLKYSIKNSGFFSKQAILILLGALIPIITNLMGFLGIVPMSIYITPITFAFTAIFFSLAIFKFNLFKFTPIALQRIVDRISDSYMVLNENYEISDYNKTFVNTFHINSRGLSFTEFLNTLELNDSLKDFNKYIKKVEDNNKVQIFELYINKIKKCFNVEITSIIVNGKSLGILILFKDITQHIKDMQTLKNNQSLLMEQERLASLGQMVGGIAHNLKTPIMSISGASEGIKDLVNEFDASIGNPIVTDDDFHDIAKEMREWLDKINSYTEYMSDILTAVKGQAVTLSEQTQIDFTLGELLKRVNILMKHELKKAVVYLNTTMNVDEDIIINGDINSLVQVINNMVSNAIQSYNGKPEQQIDLIAWKNDKNNLVISIKDYGSGLPENVRKKLFREMITTKGKNGTGLGLYMSYSTIKAHFNGDITFETETGKGTTFNIILP